MAYHEEDIFGDSSIEVILRFHQKAISEFDKRNEVKFAQLQCKHPLNPIFGPPLNQSTHTFHYWVKKYEMEHAREKGATVDNKFIPLSISRGEVQKAEKSQIVLAYPNGVRLEMNEQVSMGYLTALIKIGGHV